MKLKLKELKDSKSGMIYTFVLIVVALFTVMVCFIALDQVIKENILDMGRENFNVSNTTLNNLEMVWNAFPFIFAISLFLLGLLTAMLSSGYG